MQTETQPKLSTLARLRHSITQVIKRLARPTQSFQREILDDHEVSLQELDDSFRDMGFINRYFGGVWLTASSLQPLLPPLQKQDAIRLLDLASGAADVPLGLAQRWSKRGYRVEITALDLNPKTVELAQKAARKARGVTKFEAYTADVFSYAYPEFDDGKPGYDFVTCSLAFHHFGPQMCVQMVELMAQQARRGFVVNDLERSWFGFFGAKFLSYTLTRQRLTKHDAPLSVLRSFSPAELLAIGQRANLPPGWSIKLRKNIFARLALVGVYNQG